MSRIKSLFKKIPVIVTIYEFIFGRLHRASIAVSVECRRIKKYLTNKTHFCYGEKNKDKTFFVITCSTKEMGVYSTILYVISFIEYALKKNYIPIIDLQRDYMPLWQNEDRKGLENPWEYYYEQPFSQYTLEEVYQSKHVIVLIDGVFKVKRPNWNIMFPIDDKAELMRWNKIIASYVRINKKLRERVEAERKRVFRERENQKVLGVGIRAGLRAGMMRNEALFDKHPKQPTCEEWISIVENKMIEWECDCLYLSCDDREYLNKFIEHFKDQCCYVERNLMHYFKDDKPIMDANERKIECVEETEQEKTEIYITEVILLSECDSLCSCIGSGAQFAYLLNGGKYEHIEVYNKGIYEGVGKNG